MKLRKVDLHTHWRTSSCFKPDDLNRGIKRARKMLGKGSVVGLVNFDDQRYEEVTSQRGCEREDFGVGVYFPEREIYIFKGQEVPTDKGHLLVFGLEKGTHIKNYRPLEDTLKEAKDVGSIIGIDHCFYRDGIGHYLKSLSKEERIEFLQDIDFIEVHTSESVLWVPGSAWRANKQAARFYEEELKPIAPDLGAIASSDGHSFREIGNSYTLLDLPPISGNSTSRRPYQELTPTEQLRRALRNSKDLSNLVGGHSLTGALEHSAKVIPLMGLSKLPRPIRKITGTEKYFEVERPEQ